MPVAGFGALLWLVGVGLVGLLILRTMVHQALGQEKSFLQKGSGAVPTSPAG